LRCTGAGHETPPERVQVRQRGPDLEQRQRCFNANPTDTPIDTAIAFAKMWDPGGMVGWKITGPGHGFTLINENNWQAAVASAPLSHLGFHARC
jgi:hypothetical protein